MICVKLSSFLPSQSSPQGSAGLGFAALTSLIPAQESRATPGCSLHTLQVCACPRNSRIQFPTIKHKEQRVSPGSLFINPGDAQSLHSISQGRNGMDSCSNAVGFCWIPPLVSPGPGD